MHSNQTEFLEKMYYSNYNQFESYAFALLGDKSDAQVAVQDAFNTACLKITDLMSSPNPIGWMNLTIKNNIRNMKRRKFIELKHLLSLEELTCDISAKPDDQIIFLEYCDGVISKDELEFIKDIIIDEISFKEIAEKLEISLWACYKRAKRIFEKLRVGLNNRL